MYTKEKRYAPYVERLIEEHKQLSERLDKLVAFLEGETFKYLPSAEQVLLRLQRQQMAAYQSTLQQRLALLNISEYTMNANASTEPQTTEPKTLETGLPEAFKEKGLFVSLNEKDPSGGIHKAGEAFIQALRDAGFKLSGTHFNITVPLASRDTYPKAKSRAARRPS